MQSGLFCGAGATTIAKANFSPRPDSAARTCAGVRAPVMLTEAADEATTSGVCLAESSTITRTELLSSLPAASASPRAAPYTASSSSRLEAPVIRTVRARGYRQRRLAQATEQATEQNASSSGGVLRNL